MGMAREPTARAALSGNIGRQNTAGTKGLFPISPVYMHGGSSKNPLSHLATPV